MRVSWLTRAEMHDRHLDACRVRVVYKQVKSRFSEGLNKHTDIKETIKVFVQLIESLTWVRTVKSVMIIFTQFPSSKSRLQHMCCGSKNNGKSTVSGKENYILFCLWCELLLSVLIFKNVFQFSSTNST